MTPRDQLLSQIDTALKNGTLLRSDLSQYAQVTSAPAVAPSTVSAASIEPPTELITKNPKRLSVVDIMFYVTGIILYAAIISIIFQTWTEASSHAIEFILTGGVGAIMWAYAYYLMIRLHQTDIARGLTNALLLTGSLSLITGGYIALVSIIDTFIGKTEVTYVPFAVMLAVLGSLHYGYDMLVKRHFTLLLSVLLFAGSFLMLAVGIADDFNALGSVYGLVFILAAVLVALGTRGLGRLKPDRENISTVFDGLAVFTALLSMYITSYDNYGALWYIALIGSIIGLFYLSIVTRRRLFLGNGAFFLVVTIVTISFRYFSEFGVTISLLLSAVGLLGSAAVASIINKRYFKTTT